MTTDGRDVGAAQEVKEFNIHLGARVAMGTQHLFGRYSNSPSVLGRFDQIGLGTVRRGAQSICAFLVDEDEQRGQLSGLRPLAFGLGRGAYLDSFPFGYVFFMYSFVTPRRGSSQAQHTYVLSAEGPMAEPNTNSRNPMRDRRTQGPGGRI